MREANASRHEREWRIGGAVIVHGNSGGPVLDEHNRVIGIAVKGVEIPGRFDERSDEVSTFVPITALTYLGSPP